MDRAPRAVFLALDLLRQPSLARAVRRQPLPRDMPEILRIAGGCEETCRKAAEAAGKPPELVARAARFYAQQALFFPEADCYRVLGAAPGASREELRSNYRWLMRWLHPDRNANQWEAAPLAARVLESWQELKTAERRAAYDRGRANRAASRARHPTHPGPAWVASPLETTGPAGGSRLAARLAAGCVGLAVLVVPWPVGERAPGPAPETGVHAETGSEERSPGPSEAGPRADGFDPG